MDPADTAAVRALKHKKLCNIGELRTILGLLSYYQQYVRDFSRIASPLYYLLKIPRELQGMTNQKRKLQTKQKCVSVHR